MKNVAEILTKAVELGASDIFIIAGAKLSFKINGQIEKVSDETLRPEDTEMMINALYELKNNRGLEKLEDDGEDDFSLALKKIARFRVNTYYQRGSKAAVLRVVNFTLPDAKELGINENILNFSKLLKGLVLITGSAGSGKSTTLACIVNEINKNRNSHVITIEDPIEYLHAHNKSIISQRELGQDTSTYLNALRASLRESPNVILIGEMRDLETIKVALSAAETGHLVLSSLHTVGVAETINRIIDVFPAEQQQQIRVQLSMVLQSVVSQQLLESVTNEMVPAFEIMTMNNAIRTQIRENKLHQIDNVIASNKANGMVLMDDSLLELYKQGVIDKENLLLHAINYDAMERKINSL